MSILDEISKFDRSIEKAGPPRGLARDAWRARHKLVCGSTPLLKGLCHIEDAANEAEAWCGPHRLPPLRRRPPPGLGWQERGAWLQVGTRQARDSAPHAPTAVRPSPRPTTCRAAHPLQGAWVCERTGKRYGIDRVWRDNKGMPCKPPRTLAVHVWTAYSLAQLGENIVDEFEKALIALEKGEVGPATVRQRNPGRNLGAGRRTHRRTRPASQGRGLQALHRARGRPLPHRAVDVQRNRWEVTVYAWGRGMESWVVDVVVIETTPP